MDWIEQLFGISPDHGDHSTETSIMIAVFSVVAVYLFSRYKRLRNLPRVEKLPRAEK